MSEGDRRSIGAGGIQKGASLHSGCRGDSAERGEAIESGTDPEFNYRCGSVNNP